jgi:hypothetical protein
MAMSQDEFIALLTPKQIGFFSAAIRGGLALYADPNLYNARVLVDHSKSVRAQIRNAHIISEARRLIATDPTLGVHEKVIRHRRLFVVNSQAYVSFKRLDDALRGRNYRTAQTERFNRQLWPGTGAGTLDLELAVTGDIVLCPSLWKQSMLPDMINVWAGYKPDPTETLFDFYIVCPDGDTNAWEWQLSAADVAELAAAAHPSETKAARKIRRRVIPRAGAAKKQATDGSLG